MAMDINYRNDGRRGTPYHYAMTHNWDLEITVVPGPLKSVTAGLLGRDGAINCSCISVSNLPNSNLSEGILSGNIRGVPFHQAAGRESSVREINFVLYEVQDYGLFRFFECWKSMAVNRFDWSQNLDAMVPQGIRIVMTDTDRNYARLSYDLFDVVCTKASLVEQMTSEPEFVKTNVSLKCGYYNIIAGTRIPASLNLNAPTRADL